jgi:hypothetical protein
MHRLATDFDHLYTRRILPDGRACYIGVHLVDVWVQSRTHTGRFYEVAL